MKKVIFLLFLSIFSFSYALETCYKGYYFFLPLVEDCITYEKNKISAYAHSTPLGSLFKRVEYKGYSIHKENLKPEFFYFVQKEGNKKMIHKYRFSEDYIFFEKEIYKLEGNRYKFQKKLTKKIKNKDYFDPFTASIYLYNVIKRKKEGFLNIFYDGRRYKVPFKVLKDENLEINSEKHRTKKIYLHPDFKTKGLLKPTGNWYIWVDKKLDIPVKLELTFTIGSFKLLLEKLRESSIRN
ncbi:DUF3108 domain-containing protein [Persephonella sp.]|uniref:DUF3108 domain-containing protein n=1 Tax=Persephonella sp. TaxID=2060922 RepID=UPI0025E829E2|nr:DUF3108 domain-containing protein [Persephonella sp.]